MCSECSRFHPNRFIFGGVIAERVKAVLLPHRVALIGSRPSTFQRAIDEPLRYPYVPQRVAQNAMLLFLPVKFNFYRKKSDIKLLCVKT